MKASVSVWNFREGIEQTKTMTQLDALSEIAQMGADGAELSQNYFPNLGAYLSELRKHAESLGIDICAVDVHNSFTDPESEVGKKEIERLKMWIKIGAEELNVPCLNVFTGSIISGVDLDTQKQWAIESFRRCMDTAEKYNMPLALENHNRLALTGNEIVEFIKQIGSPLMKANPDPTNFTDAYDLTGKSSEEIHGMVFTETKKVARYMANAHLKHGFHDDRIEMGSEGVKHLLSIYREAGYDGHVALEWAGAVVMRETTTNYLNLLRQNM
jgi:sugar phosphate isomerase/epimerase